METERTTATNQTKEGESLTLQRSNITRNDSKRLIVCKSVLIGLILTLTARVFKAVDSVGQKADTAQEPSPLLLVDFLVIPHADGDRVRFPDVSEGEAEKEETWLISTVCVNRKCMQHVSTRVSLRMSPSEAGETHIRHRGYR